MWCVPLKTQMSVYCKLLAARNFHFEENWVQRRCSPITGLTLNFVPRRCFFSDIQHNKHKTKLNKCCWYRENANPDKLAGKFHHYQKGMAAKLLGYARRLQWEQDVQVTHEFVFFSWQVRRPKGGSTSVMSRSRRVASVVLACSFVSSSWDKAPQIDCDVKLLLFVEFEGPRKIIAQLYQGETEGIIDIITAGAKQKTWFGPKIPNAEQRSRKNQAVFILVLSKTREAS